MVRRRAVVRSVVVGDERAVRRERRAAARLVICGQLARVGGRVDVEDVDRLAEVDVPALAAQGAERDLLAVGRPCGKVVLTIALGELPLVATIDADDEEVLAAIADPADAVELVEDAREAARRALAVI